MHIKHIKIRNLRGIKGATCHVAEPFLRVAQPAPPVRSLDAESGGKYVLLDADRAQHPRILDFRRETTSILRPLPRKRSTTYELKSGTFVEIFLEMASFYVVCCTL